MFYIKQVLLPNSPYIIRHGSHEFHTESPHGLY